MQDGEKSIFINKYRGCKTHKSKFSQTVEICD